MRRFEKRSNEVIVAIAGPFSIAVIASLRSQ
jgi:hypothetical protein